MSVSVCLCVCVGVASLPLYGMCTLKVAYFKTISKPQCCPVLLPSGDSALSLGLWASSATAGHGRLLVLLGAADLLWPSAATFRAIQLLGGGFFGFLIYLAALLGGGRLGGTLGRPAALSLRGLGLGLLLLLLLGSDLSLILRHGD